MHMITEGTLYRRAHGRLQPKSEEKQAKRYSLKDSQTEGESSPAGSWVSPDPQPTVGAPHAREVCTSLSHQFLAHPAHTTTRSDAYSSRYLLTQAN